MYYIEKALLQTGTVNEASEHIKNVRMIAQYLLSEKAFVPQVLAKAFDLKELMSDGFWNAPSVLGIEKKRNALRDLMQFFKCSGRKKFDIDISDTVEDAEYQSDDTMMDIRTYREKVIDYLAENSNSPVIKKIHNL